VTSAGVFFSFLSLRMISINKKLYKENFEKLEFDSVLSLGFTFSEKVIIYKTENELTAFSSRCTHLGCTINQTDGVNLVCGCHGSKFSPKGEVMQGPAQKNLIALEHHFENNKLIVFYRNEAR